MKRTNIFGILVAVVVVAAVVSIVSWALIHRTPELLQRKCPTVQP